MNDTQLQLALAKMLPDLLYADYLPDGKFVSIRWKTDKPVFGKKGRSVVSTEWLHVCWLVEQTLDRGQRHDYLFKYYPDDDWELAHTSWQQRATALCKVKGITP